MILVDIAFTDNPASSLALDIVDEMLQETSTYTEVGSADEEARWQQGVCDSWWNEALLKAKNS